MYTNQNDIIENFDQVLIPGDLVVMKHIPSPVGIVIEQILYGVPTEEVRWVQVLWPDQGKTLEKARDLSKEIEVANENR